MAGLSVAFAFPKELARNPRLKDELRDIGAFIRDLWLARAPYASGAYVKGLLDAGSIKIAGGQLIVENMAPGAAFYEYGHRSFNLAQKILAGGKGVKTSKEGFRYKIISIKPGKRSAFRGPKAAANVIRSFQKVKPIGMKAPKVDKLGMSKPYKPQRALQRPIAGKKRSGPEGIFVISEKSQRQDPRKWQIPAVSGKFLARAIQKEARPYVVAAFREAIRKEQAARAKKPSWSKPGIVRDALKVIPQPPRRK